MIVYYKSMCLPHRTHEISTGNGPFVVETRCTLSHDSLSLVAVSRYKQVPTLLGRSGSLNLANVHFLEKQISAHSVASLAARPPVNVSWVFDDEEDGLAENVKPLEHDFLYEVSENWMEVESAEQIF